MSYVLGSQTESIAFTSNGIDYGPAGLTHAIDTQSPINSPSAVLAHALCGEAVRAWPDQTFDINARDVHDECVALTRRS